MRARLLKSMYGIRDAAQSWERECARTLTGLRFLPGLAPLCVFYHPTRDVRIVLHGDGLTAPAFGVDGHWLCGLLEKSCQAKVGGILGPEASYGKSIRIFNRVATW